MNLMAIPAMLLGVVVLAAEPPSLLPTVEIEETVYSYTPPDNGSGPMWCMGATCIVRDGAEVFISGVETLESREPLNNVRWVLYRRGEAGWAIVARDEDGFTREPCPLAVFPADNALLLSTNPTLVPDARAGAAQPQMLVFDTTQPDGGCDVELPIWQGDPPFTEHSYRSLAVDGPGGEIALFNILGYERYHWSLRDSGGAWSESGEVVFPWEEDYPQPRHIRLCYPEIVLKDRACHFLGISDIIEPYPEWRAYKKEVTGQDWDYDFRRLFYASTPDLVNEPFGEWVEVASRDETAGWINGIDLHVDDDGDAHLFWRERSTDKRMQEKFFPETPLTFSLHHGVVRDGKLVLSEILAIGGDGHTGVIPGAGRLQITPDGRMFLFYYAGGTDDNGERVSENRVMEVYPGGGHSDSVRVDLQHPFTNFFTATPRGGAERATTIDIYGIAAGVPEPKTLRYARIALE